LFFYVTFLTKSFIVRINKSSKLSTKKIGQNRRI
jgi:hypothetical protein